MNEEHFQRVSELFAQARKLGLYERDLFLGEACKGDEDLRRDVEKLHNASKEPLPFAELADQLRGAREQISTATATVQHSTIIPAGGTRIGPYELLEKIGEGGAGLVYVAEQKQPVKRRVALKIIKLGMDTRQVIARFKAEGQALAMMDHPNIAKVFDAGETDTGRPYFVMELVRGVPITEYCDTQNLDTRTRLDLFTRVCHAIQHAHQKGVIHRDIKPSNVMVTLHDGVPIPKVIDFGIAKAINAELTERTIYTLHHQMIGTPTYMSPEQAEMSGLDIDTRSDIYSLGVLLYELLTGTTPFDHQRLRSVAYGEIQRIIREEEPHKPSARVSSLLSFAAVRLRPGRIRAGEDPAEPCFTDPSSALTIARHRRTDPKSLSIHLRCDLDWIVMKCLEKDRTRRYQTANGVASDIQRHLENQPVEAGPPTAAYRFRKFARRNKATIFTGVVIAASLLVGLALAITGFVAASRDRDRAKEAEQLSNQRAGQLARRADEIEQIATFQAEMLARVDPQRMARRLHKDLLSEIRSSLERRGLPFERIEEEIRQIDDVLVGLNLTNVTIQSLDEGILKESLATIRERFASQPAVKASLLQTAAATYVRLGMFDAALPPLTEALEIRRQTLGDDHPDTLKTIQQTVALFNDMRRWADSEPYIQEAYERTSNTLPDDDPTRQVAILHMADLLKRQRRFDEAEPLCRQVLDARRRLLGDDHLDTLGPLAALTSVLREQGKNTEAEPLAQQAMDLRRRALDLAHDRERLDALFELAFWLRVEGEAAEAEAYYREALELSRRELGDAHHETNGIVNNISTLLMSQGRWQDAETFLRDALRRCRQALGEDNLDTLTVMTNLGLLLHKVENYDEAEPLLHTVVQRRRRIQGDDNPETLNAMRCLAIVLRPQENWAEAESVLREMVEGAQRGLGEKHRITSSYRLYWGKTLTELERYAEAERQLLIYERYMRDPEGGFDHLGRSWLEGMAKLYTDWHTAEPYAGYDVKAAEWRAKTAEAKSPQHVTGEQKGDLP